MCTYVLIVFIYHLNSLNKNLYNLLNRKYTLPLGLLKHWKKAQSPITPQGTQIENHSTNPTSYFQDKKQRTQDVRGPVQGHSAN